MRIAVKTISENCIYLNFDLIVEFYFEVRENDTVRFTYSSKTEDNCEYKMIITLEEKNRILNKLDLL